MESGSDFNQFNRLKNTTFLASCRGFLEFELTIQNNSAQELVVNINGNDFSLTDDGGQSYTNREIWWDYGPNDPSCHPHRLSDLEIMTIGPGQRIDMALRVLGDPASSVNEFNFVIFRAGRIENAQWVIKVPK